MDVAKKTQNCDGCVNYYIGFGMLYKNTALTQLLMLFVNINRKLSKIECFLPGLFTECKVERVHAEECDQGHGSINIITESLNELGSLRLNYV